MDGTTWRRYRLLTERGPQPTFFLEPDNPDDWPNHYLSSGFTVLAQYCSALNAEIGQTDPRAAEVAGSLSAGGVTIRPLNPDGFLDELQRIYLLSVASFRNNFLYSPISEEEFLSLYQVLEPVLVPDLVLFAEVGGQPIGFIFALPDLNEAQREQRVDTIIIKTIAVHPEFSGQGLGSLLSARCQEVACRLGYRRAIHALMHESNQSRRISAHYNVRTIRRYALFARELSRVP
jgi:GNAT superfamily N-acetyltransferase